MYYIVQCHSECYLKVHGHRNKVLYKPGDYFGHDNLPCRDRSMARSWADDDFFVSSFPWDATFSWGCPGDYFTRETKPF